MTQPERIAWATHHSPSPVAMKILPIALNSDNYGYVLIAQSTQRAALIDISNQPEVIQQFISTLDIKVVMILTTHKHWDHAGGNLIMKSSFPGLVD
jgi:hydroxyacylglutathione hydrolase